MTKKTIYSLTTRLLSSAIALIILNSCSSKVSQPVAVETNYDKLYSTLFNRCGACHGTGAADTAGGPDLRTKAKVHSDLVGKTAASDFPDWDTFTVNRADCAQIPFVDEKSSATSLVVAVLDEAVATSLSPCVVKSHLDPPQSITVTAETLTLLKTWIDAGAEK